MQQRQGYSQTPPLYHPVPQHVSTVPQLRSPPPPATQSARQSYDGGSNPFTQNQGVAPDNMFGQYGNFVNDPAAGIAAHLGQSAFKSVEQNVGRWISRRQELKHYFNVSNAYVLNKLFLVLFPWRHKPWARKHHGGGANSQPGAYMPPRDDINSPDMYIPVMSLVTYILLSTLIAGIRGQFQPELLGLTASTALAVVFMELVALKLGAYFLDIQSSTQLLDLVAYSGYKFVGIIVTITLAEIFSGGKGTGGWVGWSVFLYTFLANSLFLMRSLKYVLLPESNVDSRGPMQTGADTRTKRNRRTKFLFGYSYLGQFFLMWVLTRA